MKCSAILVVTLAMSNFALAARRDVSGDQVFRGGPTYAEAVELFFSEYVFPREASWKEFGVTRDNVVSEKVERDGNSWWIRCRARYRGKTPVGKVGAERATVHYDNGQVKVEFGKAELLNTEGIKHWIGKIAPWTREHVNRRSHGEEIRHGDKIFLRTRVFHQGNGEFHYLNVPSGYGPEVKVHPGRSYLDKESDEIFWIEKQSQEGPVKHADEVLLHTRGRAGRLYWLQAPQHGPSDVIAVDRNPVNRDPQGSQEIFWIERHAGEGVVSSGDMVYLRTKTHHYLNSPSGTGRVKTIKVNAENHPNRLPRKSDEIWWIEKVP